MKKRLLFHVNRSKFNDLNILKRQLKSLVEWIVKKHVEPKSMTKFYNISVFDDLVTDKTFISIELEIKWDD